MDLIEVESTSSDGSDEKKELDDELIERLMRYQHTDNIVENLSTLALKHCMKSLIKEILQNIQEYDPDLDEYKNPTEEKMKEFEKIVAYHKQHRELLASTNIIDVYSDIIDYMFGHPDERDHRYGIKEFLFWCCYENTESKKLNICDDYFNENFEHSSIKKIEFISESDSDFPHCTKMSVVFSDYVEDFGEIEDLFSNGKFPNLKDLTVNIENMGNNNDFIAAVLPNLMKKLKKLNIKFVEGIDIGLFKDEIRKMKQEEVESSIEELHLNVTNFYRIGTEQLFQDDPEHWNWSSPLKEEVAIIDYMIEAVSVLKNVKEFHLEGWRYYEMKSRKLGKTAPEDEERISNVRSVTFTSIPIDLVKINNNFNNLVTLAINNFQFPEDHLEKITSLPSLNTVKNLSINFCKTFRGKLRKLRISAWIRLFPTLEKLELRKIVQDDTLPSEMKTLKVFRIRDRLTNPIILSKFPNLQRFEESWPEEKYMNEEILKLKPHLPQFCKLYYNDLDTTREGEIVL